LIFIFLCISFVPDYGKLEWLGHFYVFWNEVPFMVHEMRLEHQEDTEGVPQRENKPK